MRKEGDFELDTKRKSIDVNLADMSSTGERIGGGVMFDILAEVLVLRTDSVFNDVWPTHSVSTMIRRT